MKKVWFIVLSIVMLGPITLVNADDNEEVMEAANQLFNIIGEDGNIIIDDYQLANAALYDENISYVYDYTYKPLVQMHIENLSEIDSFFENHPENAYYISFDGCESPNDDCYIMISTDIHCATPKGSFGLAQDLEVGQTITTCINDRVSVIKAYNVTLTITDDYDMNLFKDIFEGRVIDGDESDVYNRPTYYIFDMQYINAFRNYQGYERIKSSYKGSEFYVPKLKNAFERHKGLDFFVLDDTESSNVKSVQPDIINHRLLFFKDNIVYWSKALTFNYAKIVLVSDTTPKTTDAYINAASKRIKEYLKDDTKFVITALPADYESYYYNPVGPFLNNAFDDDYEYTTSLVDNELQMYTIQIGDYTDDFYIVAAPDEKINGLEFGSYESDTGFLAKSNSGDVPLDATLVVDDVTNNIKKKYDNVVLAYDINLQSVVDNQFINYAKDGIKIMIPVSNDFDLTGKSVYYIDDNGEKGEKYSSQEEIINSKKYVSFVTTHFSTYAILLDNEVVSQEKPISSGKEVPNTGVFTPIIPIAIIFAGGFVILKKQKRIFKKI